MINYSNELFKSKISYRKIILDLDDLRYYLKTDDYPLEYKISTDIFHLSGIFHTVIIDIELPALYPSHDSPTVKFECNSLSR